MLNKTGVFVTLPGQDFDDNYLIKPPAYYTYAVRDSGALDILLHREGGITVIAATYGPHGWIKAMHPDGIRVAGQ